MVAPIKKPTPPGALKRIEQLETTTGAVVSAVNKTFTEYNSKLNSIVEALEAVIATVGPEEVKRAMDERRAAQDAARLEAQKKAVADAVASGQLKSTSIITPTAFVVGTETRDGAPVGTPTGRVQVEVVRLGEAICGGLLGQQAGFVLKTPDGTDFAIEEIYEIVPQQQQVQATPDADPAKAEELAAVEEFLADGGEGTETEEPVESRAEG